MRPRAKVGECGTSLKAKRMEEGKGLGKSGGRMEAEEIQIW